ncbi:MAG: hypothetical protein ACK4TB_10160 [Gemmobacter sp.]
MAYSRASATAGAGMGGNGIGRLAAFLLFAVIVYAAFTGMA